MDLITIILIGLFAGWIAGMIMKEEVRIVGDSIIGIIGALWADFCSIF